MINKDDFKIELPHYIKQDIVIDLLIQNLAYTKALSKYLIEENSQKNHKSADEIQNELTDDSKRMKYEILAFIASKYGK